MDPSDKELLVRIDERVGHIHTAVHGDENNPGLLSRVTVLETVAAENRGSAKVITYLGGGGGIMGALTALWHFFAHK